MSKDRWAEDNYCLDRWVDCVLDPRNAPPKKRRWTKRKHSENLQEKIDRRHRLKLDVPANEHYSKVLPGALKATIAERCKWLTWPGEREKDAT